MATTDQDKSMKDKARDATAEASRTVKSHAKDAADKAAREASSYADHAKDVAADEVKGVASALRTAADEFRDGSAQERTFSQIADGLADISDSMRNKDLGDIAGSINSFARRNPVMFLGGAALVGLAATRFAKASSDRSRSTDYSAGRRHQENPLDRPLPDSPPTSRLTPHVDDGDSLTTSRGVRS